MQHIPNMIVRIEAMGRRVYVSDVQESIFMVRYKSAENQLIIFADDTQPRWITTTTILDYNTVATADKFGNIAVVSIELLIISQLLYNGVINKISILLTDSVSD